VLCAATAEKAMQIAQDYRGALDLLLTGYSMPGLTGAELAEKLLQSRPGLPVMLMSSESEGHASASGHKWYFTAKPFSASVLLSHIGDALGASMWCLCA
jgi:CheY-like chemotaxis protein